MAVLTILNEDKTLTNVEEIAASLATPLGTVKSWIHRGLAALKGCLER